VNLLLPHEELPMLLPDKPPKTDIFLSVLSDAHSGHAGLSAFSPETSSSNSFLQLLHVYSNRGMVMRPFLIVD
jgi:hypothetical protein